MIATIFAAPQCGKRKGEKIWNLNALNGEAKSALFWCWFSRRTREHLEISRKAYEGGGGAYILIYLAIVILIGIPVMLSELTIGRGAQANAIDSYGKLGHPGYKWVGWFGVIVAFIITSYYAHVGGWVLRYVVSYATEPEGLCRSTGLFLCAAG